MPTAADYADLLHRLGQLRQSHTRAGDPAWYGHCPVCGDRSPTHLRLWLKAGRMYAKCYGGKCAAVARPLWWRALLDATGTAAADWRGGVSLPRGRRKRLKIDSTYDYRDEKNRLVFQCVKFAPPDPAKPDPGWRKNSYRRPAHQHDDAAKVRTDDKGNKWVWDGAGLDLDKLELGEIVPAAPFLYRLPELIQADHRQPVLLCAGEPDVETARALGFVATCNPHGERNITHPMCMVLSGRRVVVLEDNDATGRLHAQLAAGILVAVGVLTVRVVTFYSLPVGGDLTDWVRKAVWSELPRSAKAAGWIAGQSDEERKRGKLAVASLIKGFAEWGPLTAAESLARQKADGPMTLQEAMAKRAA